MKVHAPEGWTGSMKRLKVTGCHWEVKARRQGHAWEGVGYVHAEPGTPYTKIRAMAAALIQTHFDYVMRLGV